MLLEVSAFPVLFFCPIEKEVLPQTFEGNVFTEFSEALLTAKIWILQNLPFSEKKKDVHKVDSKINDKSVVETSPLLHQHVAMHRKWSFFDWKATRRRSLQGSGCWFYLCSPKVNSKNCFFVMTILELSFPIVQEQTSLNKFDCL